MKILHKLQLASLKSEGPGWTCGLLAVLFGRVLMLEAAFAVGRVRRLATNTPIVREFQIETALKRVSNRLQVSFEHAFGVFREKSSCRLTSVVDGRRKPTIPHCMVLGWKR